MGTLLTKMQFLKVKYLIDFINKSSHRQAFVSKLADTLGAPAMPTFGGSLCGVIPLSVSTEFG